MKFELRNKEYKLKLHFWTSNDLKSKHFHGQNCFVQTNIFYIKCMPPPQTYTKANVLKIFPYHAISPHL
jgi:hypothetical protein